MGTAYTMKGRREIKKRGNCLLASVAQREDGCATGLPSAPVSMSVHIPASAISANYEEDDISRSSDASEEDNKELETFDDWIEEERPCKSLFDDDVLDSVSLAIEYDSKTHAFDIGAVSKRLGVSNFRVRV